MNEHVLAAAVWLNEPVPLGGIESTSAVKVGK
jgi:hypothetical protein